MNTRPDSERMINTAARPPTDSLGQKAFKITDAAFKGTTITYTITTFTKQFPNAQYYMEMADKYTWGLVSPTISAINTRIQYPTQSNAFLQLGCIVVSAIGINYLKSLIPYTENDTLADIQDAAIKSVGTDIGARFIEKAILSSYKALKTCSLFSRSSERQDDPANSSVVEIDRERLERSSIIMVEDNQFSEEVNAGDSLENASALLPKENPTHTFKP